MHDNCTSAYQTLLYGRENHLIHSVRQDAGNLLRGTRRADEGRRVCTTPWPQPRMDNFIQQIALRIWNINLWNIRRKETSKVPRRSRRREASLFSPEQTERVILASGGTIAGEVDTDWIIFCPYHSNTRTPAAEIDKENGTFFCFGCRKIASLMEYVMTMTGSNEFTALRLIKKYGTARNMKQIVCIRKISRRIRFYSVGKPSS